MAMGPIAKVWCHDCRLQYQGRIMERCPGCNSFNNWHHEPPIAASAAPGPCPIPDGPIGGPAYGPWWGLRHWLWAWFRKPAIALVWLVVVAFFSMPIWADFNGEHVGNEKVPMGWMPVVAIAVVVLVVCAIYVTEWLLGIGIDD